MDLKCEHWAGAKFFATFLWSNARRNNFEGLVLLKPNLAYFWSNCVASGDQAVFDLLQTMVPAGQLCYSLRLSVERSSGYTTHYSAHCTPLMVI